MKKLLFLAFVSFLIFVNSVTAYNEITVGENMLITIPKDDFIYINVLIPDDLGVTELGEYEYVIESTAGSSWDDLSEQSVTTDIFQPALIPIEFNSLNKDEGDCSGPFYIRLSSLALGKSRSWSGEVCVSGYADIDAPSGTVPEEEESNNDNMDMFDADFIPEEKTAKPGEDVTYTLSIKSHAELEFDITLGNEVTMSADRDFVFTDSDNPRKDITVTVTAPNQTGNHDFTALIEADCGEQFCTRTITGRLIVSDTDVPEDFFTVSIFPDGLNVRDLEPMDFQLTIHNPGQEKTFDLELKLPSSFTSEFEDTSITVAAGEDRNISFTADPFEDFNFELVKMYVSYGNRRRMAVAQVSKDEMLTDTRRQAEELLARADEETASEINAAMDDWEESYSESSYGNEFGEYGKIKDRLKAAEEKIEQQSIPESGDDLVIISDTEEPVNPMANPLLMGLIIAAVVGIILFIIYKRKGSEEPDGMDFNM